MQIPSKNVSGKQCSELTLGTVQLGLNYGAANKTGLPDEEVAIEILRQASAYGVMQLDTARAYGESESRIGKALKVIENDAFSIITKLGILSELTENSSAKTVLNAVEKSIQDSCGALGQEYLEMLMLHRWSHYQDFKGIAWQKLVSLVEEGVISNLGVSVQSPFELLQALKEPRIKAVQLPYNVLDWRWKEANIADALAKRDDVVVYARSVFLQGLLIAELECWPKIQGLDPTEWIIKLKRVAGELGCQNRAELCVAYVRSQPWITSLVMGVETVKQLQENVSYFQKAPLSSEEAAYVEKILFGVPVQLLDPAQWPR